MDNSQPAGPQGQALHRILQRVLPRNQQASLQKSEFRIEQEFLYVTADESKGKKKHLIEQ